MSDAEKKRFYQKIETIDRNSENLLHLVNQMLDLARLEHGRLEYNPIRANIIPWLQYIVESHHSLAEAREIQLTFYPETESVVMDYDPDQLSKVISNLFTNAIKFTGKRGKVICHVKQDQENNRTANQSERHRHRHPGRRAGPDIRPLLPGGNNGKTEPWRDWHRFVADQGDR